MIFNALSEKLELLDLLESLFKDDAQLILDVATYMIMSENNVMKHIDDYCFNHSLFSDAVIDDNEVGRLFSRLKVKTMDSFLKMWVEKSIGEKVYIAYDSTIMNSVACDLDLVEYGHAKVDDSLPQINLSLGYDQTPLFYEIYPGSIIDNSECSKMVDRALSYGSKNIGFIVDRGYFSLSTIRYFEENNFDYILMTKGNTKFIQNAINETIALLKNSYSCYIEDYELYGTSIETELFKTSKKQTVHGFYNGVKAEEDKLKINHSFNLMYKALEEKKNKKIKQAKDVDLYKKYYYLKFDDNGYFLHYRRKDDEIKKLMTTAVCFTIITSEKMDTKKALEIYRDRDAVEKVFRMEKSYLGCDVFRVHSNEKLESKVFVSFIALILRNALYQSLKPLIKKNRKEYTVTSVIRKLNRLGLTKLSDDSYHVRYELTHQQKQLLKVFGINEKDYDNFCKNIVDNLEVAQ